MGIFDFIKDAGEKIFNPGEARQEAAVTEHLQGYDIAGLEVEVDGGTVILGGTAKDQATRERAVLAAGNVSGIERVDDRLTVAAGSPDFGNVVGSATTVSASAPAGASATTAEATPGGGSGWTSKTYTVESGDTLSRIAEQFYGDANKYPLIFEANQPMLKDPDKIYPGQVLRIPGEA